MGKLTAKVTQERIENHDNVTISVIASTERRIINQSIATVLKTIFTGLEIVKYNALSLNYLIKTGKGSFTKLSEDLDKLFFKVFSRDDKNINTSYLHQLNASLTSKDMNDFGLTKLFYLILKMGYTDIKEFGY